jgi:hypothetical protein
MMVYAKSLLVGLCAAAIVFGVCWRAGLCPSVVYPPQATLRSSAVVPSGDGPSASLSVELGDTTVTRVPWYVDAVAGLALVTASGWQLRRSPRGRR